MRIELAYVTPRRQRLKSIQAQALLDDYVKRANRYVPVEAAAYDSESALLSGLDRNPGRTSTTFLLLDSRGKSLTSEGIAEQLRAFRDSGVQQLTAGIGPADGWSPAARKRADLSLSLGAVTLPHELAMVILAEQMYRAFSILAGHPYHGGHA